MHRFWNSVIGPLLDAGGAARVVEIGVDRGATTRLLLERAERIRGGVVHAIDPAPKLDVAAWQARFGPRLRLHRERSLEALGGVGPVDAVLVDGDHNWFTVSRELELIGDAAAGLSEPLPLVIAHDAGWPYGRRDMYYELDSVPAEERWEARREGVLPGRPELSADGINPWLWNATREGGARNGVRTALEDFASSQDPPCELFVLEGFHGLGVLLGERRLEAAPELREALARLRSPEFAHAWIRTLEQARVDAQIEAWWAMGRPQPEDAPPEDAPA